MDEEMIDIYDEAEKVIATVSRNEADKKNLLRMSASIIIMNGCKLLIHKRGGSQNANPGKWDYKVGGCSQSGETPEECACREANEEIGAKDLDLKLLLRVRYKSPGGNDFAYIYSAEYRGEIKPDKSEITQYEWIDVNELPAVMKEREFARNAVFFYEKYGDELLR